VARAALSIIAVVVLVISFTSSVAARPPDFCQLHPSNPHCVTPTPTASLTPTPTPSVTASPTASPTLTASPSPSPSPSNGWSLVVDDEFNSGGIPSHWGLYNGPYGSNAHNCAAPSQDFVTGGYLHLLESYLPSGNCGAAWYTGGMRLNGFSTVDQRVTLRFRIVDSGVSAHYVIPMRWPDDDSSWPAGGEEDYCEADVTTGCSTYLHYSSTNQQVAHAYSVDLSQFHTLQFTRLNHVVTASIDGTVVWTYSGSSTTLPDTLKHVVLQQECHATGCPSGTSGNSEIQVDWITVENPTGTPTPTPTSSASGTFTPTPTPTLTASPSPTASPSSTFTPTPTPTSTPSSGAKHVFVIVMENHSYSEVFGTSATPYTNGLVATWAHASNYFAIMHPSLPNYLDLYAGSNHGITTDCDPSSTCHITGTSLLDEFLAKGLSAKGYFENMPAPCTLTNPGTYRAHHDPLIYFDDMWQNTAPGSLCYTHVVPMFPNLTNDLASAATTPNWSFVKPDNCDDTHDCSISTGDTWLSQHVPTILNSPACTVDKCLVILTWDEDDGSQGNQVLTVFAGSMAKAAFTDATAYNHFGLLRTTEDIFGLPYQAADATATSMAGMVK